MKDQLKIAYFQQDIAWEDPSANHRMVEEAFASVPDDIDVLVVPEGRGGLGESHRQQRR